MRDPLMIVERHCTMKTQINPNVGQFLAKPLPHFIGNQPFPGTYDTTGKVLNPSDGSVLAEVAMGGTSEIEQAVVAAEQLRAHNALASVTLVELFRQQWLRVSSNALGS